MTTVDLGKVGIRYMGEWDSSVTYEPLDYVRNINNGNGYIATASNRNIVPGTDTTKWSKAVSSGQIGGATIKHKITYAASETSVSDIEWDTIHVFPEMASLSLTFDTAPSDDKDHEMLIVFSTPSDLTNFSLSLDSAVIWSGVALTSNLLPSAKYVISIDSSDMVATYIVASGSATPRRFDTIEEVALPIGAKYKIRFISDVPQSLMTYSTSNSAILTVDSEGFATGVSSGTATATVNWAGSSRTITFYVGQEVIDTSSIIEQDRTIDQVSIINPISTIEEGDEYVLFAVGISNSLSPKYDMGYYNSVKFSSSDTSVATVMYGTLMAVGQGTCTITASDLNDNATDSFQLTVVAQQIPTATSQETYIPDIDNTGETDVTVAMAEAFAYASANGYKKISFPQGTYLMSGDNRPDAAAIQIPGNMIIDFNGSEIHFDDSSTVVTEGYTMFTIFDKENVWLKNLTILAENYNRDERIVKESDRTLTIRGLSKNVHIENCTFGYSPGFNVGLGYVRNTSYPDLTPSTDFSVFRLDNVEAGGFDANGDPVSAENTFRSINYLNVRSKTDGWCFGCVEGYQEQYIRSRLYDMYFYDEDHNFMYRKQNCYQYRRYTFEGETKPTYCKIAFFQENAPTNGYDPTQKNIAWVFDVHNPKDIYFKNCTFKFANSTGLSPQGGEHIVIDGCTFVDNGYRDPYSHIDWEDGRFLSQGHIVKNCVFTLDKLNATYGGHYTNGQIIQGYCTDIVLHDNLMQKCYFRTLQYGWGTRTFHNVFQGDSPHLSASEESVFAGNLLDKEPVFTPEVWYRAKYLYFDNEVVQ